MAQTFGLGVGASAPDSVQLRVDGKVKTYKVASESPTPAAQSFLNCLVAGRVLKIEAGGKKLLMLDNSDVAMLLHEFTQSKTTIDPCDLGKAAYRPAHVSPAMPAAKAAPVQPTATPAEQPKKKLSRATPASAKGDDEKMKTLGVAFGGATPQAAPAQNTAGPTGGIHAASVETAKVGTVSSGSTTTPAATGATSVATAPTANINTGKPVDLLNPPPPTKPPQ